jgi:hypothetical protein
MGLFLKGIWKLSFKRIFRTYDTVLLMEFRIYVPVLLMEFRIYVPVLLRRN